jgi:hypothetical protein
LLPLLQVAKVVSTLTALQKELNTPHSSPSAEKAKIQRLQDNLTFVAGLASTASGRKLLRKCGLFSVAQPLLAPPLSIRTGKPYAALRKHALGLFSALLSPDGSSESDAMQEAAGLSVATWLVKMAAAEKDDANVAIATSLIATVCK